jgi:hypothetical protein
VGHMRNYGSDFGDKLKKACLEYDKYLPSEVVSSEEFKRYGLKDDWVFICRKACQ